MISFDESVKAVHLAIKEVSNDSGGFRVDDTVDWLLSNVPEALDGFLKGQGRRKALVILITKILDDERDSFLGITT